MVLVDSITAAVYLTDRYGRLIRPALIRQWASRYPSQLPRRGIDSRGRTLYALEDAEKLAERLESNPEDT